MEEAFINNPFVVGKYLSDKYFCDCIFRRYPFTNSSDIRSLGW